MRCSPHALPRVFVTPRPRGSPDFDIHLISANHSSHLHTICRRPAACVWTDCSTSAHKHEVSHAGLVSNRPSSTSLQQQSTTSLPLHSSSQMPLHPVPSVSAAPVVTPSTRLLRCTVTSTLRVSNALPCAPYTHANCSNFSLWVHGFTSPSIPLAQLLLPARCRSPEGGSCHAAHVNRRCC